MLSLSADACTLMAQVIPVLLLVVTVQHTGHLYVAATWSWFHRLGSCFYVILFLTGEALAVIGATRSDGLVDPNSLFAVLSSFLIWMTFFGLIMLLAFDWLPKVWNAKAEE